jgi:hypothetical protein
MNFGKLTIGIAGAAVIGGGLLALLMQHRTNVSICEKEEALHRQRNQLAELTAEQARLSTDVAQLETAPSVEPRPALPELQRLRNEAERLRQQISELEAKSETERQLRRAKERAASAYPPGYDYNELPDYLQRRHAMSAGQHDDAMSLAMAVVRYAKDHQGEISSDLERLAPYLRKYDRKLTGTNEFEIIHTGTLDRVTNYPSHSVAIFRERQPWLAPSGRWARYYGKANGGCEVVESVDNFAAWEAEHVIPPEQ